MTNSEFAKKSYEYALGAIKASSHPPLTEDELRRLGDADIHDFPRLLDEFGWGRGIEVTCTAEYRVNLNMPSILYVTSPLTLR